MARLFGSIYDFFATHRKSYWCVLIVSFLLVSFGASRIRFESNINNMIPHDPDIEAMDHILNHTRTGEQLVFTLRYRDERNADPEELIAAQAKLEEQLATWRPRYIKSINSVQSSDKEQMFSEIAINYLPIFLNEHDYRSIDSLCDIPDLQAHFEQLRRSLQSPAGIVTKNFIATDPLNILPLAFAKFQTLRSDPNYELYNGYIFNKGLSELTFFVSPAFGTGETGKNKPFVEALNELISRSHKEYPQIEVQYFGGAAVAVANADQMQEDTILTLGMTIVLLLALTYYVFKRKRIAVLLLVPVLFGALFGMSISALLQPKVSIIAIGAGAIILGIAVDFSVHFMSHTRTARSIRDTVTSLSAPLTLGAITTIGAFFALRYANAPLLRDLGTFAGFALMGASLFTLVLLPHISPQPQQGAKDTIIDKIAERRPEGNKWLLLLVVVATPVLWYFSGTVGFQSDLMQLNYMSPELKRAETALNKSNAYALSSLFVLSRGDSEEEALRSLERHGPVFQSLTKNGLVRDITDPSNILPSISTQKARIERWQAFWTEERKATLLRRIKRDAEKAGFTANAFDAFESMISKGHHPLDDSARRFLQEMLPASFANKDGLYYAISTIKVAPGKRQEVLQVLANEKQLESTDRRSVTEKLLSLLKDDFNKLLLLSGGLVFIALLIAYGRIELALISFLPMAVSWVWITGIMSLLGLQFNVVNIVIATLLFGLGDDYSIFMMDGLMEKYKTGKNHIRSARSAVYLSVLTTIIGLGTLIFAQHPALRSIAAIAIVGLLCVVFIAQVLQPFLFNFFIQHRADKGFMPFTLTSFIRSVVSFLYFVIGCLVISIIGIFLVRLKIIGSRKGKYVFHWLLSKYTGSVIYLNHRFDQKVIRNTKVDFEVPAVYIANHSSFLDILIMTMLHPKIVLLTNKWVYRSPVFGAVVRMAEYYPVADGAESSIEPLRDLVGRGYSIVVFPEGTRASTDTIARFHKGAFYIAEQLRLDIVPVILHGAHYTMQKGDFLLKNGPIHIELLAPIPYDDRTWGNDVKARTKSISAFFKKTFADIRQEKETPGYFREQLIMGNIYKSPIREWYCRIKIRLENNYELMHQLLPLKGTIYDLGCGYGFATYLLHWSAPARRFIGIDYDEEKIITAQHHYKRTEQVTFVAADISRYPLQPCDGIIISDVLHYLPAHEQMGVLEECYAALNPGGVLILRDGVKELASRHKGTELSEKFSTKILKFNKTQNPLHFIYQKDIADWALTKGMSFETIDTAKKTSNLTMIMRKPGEHHAVRDEK